MIIELEDGRKFEVEDGASQQQIDEFVTHLSSGPSAQTPTPPTPQAPPSSVSQTGVGESVARGYLQGGSLGFGDEIMGGLAAGGAKLFYPELFKDQTEGLDPTFAAKLKADNPGMFEEQKLGDLYKTARDSVRQDNAIAQESHPWWYGGGQLAGTVATGMKIPMPASGAGQLVAGAGLGGLSGYGASDSNTLSGQLMDTGIGTVAGLGGTYLGQKIGQGVAAAANSRMGQGAKDTIKTMLQKFYVPEQQLSNSVDDIARNPIMVEAMKKGATPEEAAILAKAGQFNVPLSRGDVIRTPEQQGLEDLALRGALGDEAAMTAQGFRQQQAQALRDSAKNTIQQLSGTPYMENAADMGGPLASRLKMMASADDAGVTSAYEGVKAAGDAKIAVPLINKHLTSAFDELKDFPLDMMPSTNSVIARAQKVFAQNPGGQFTAPADLTKIDNFRKFINRASSSVQLGNNSDKAGVQIIKSKLDGAIDEAIENNLVYGNPEAIGKLKNAREMARDYFTRWKSDDAIQKIVENEYTPEQVLNLVRGYGQVGGNKQAAQLVGKLGDILGKDSPEFGQLKQAQLQQIFGKNLDSLMSGDLQKGFSAEEVRKNLSQLFANNKSLANAYFSNEDQKVLKDFLEVSYRATNRVPGAANTSNTTPALIRWGRQFANQFGVLGRMFGAPAELLGQGMSGIKRGAEAQQAIQSFSPQFSNPNNALATALRDRLAKAGAAAGGSLAGQATASKQPLRVTVHPSDRNLQSFYK